MSLDFPSLQELLEEEKQLTFNQDQLDPLLLGEFISQEIIRQNLPLCLIVRYLGRTVFQIGHPGSQEINDLWMLRKARVAETFGHSSLYVLVEHEASGRPFESHGLDLSQYAFFGGGYPLNSPQFRTFGSIGISGTLQLEEHRFLVKVLDKFRNSVEKSRL